MSLPDTEQRDRDTNAKQHHDDSAPRRVVVTYSRGATGAPDGHEASTRREIAQRLAMVAGFAYEGEYDSACNYAAPLYFVPSDTLTSETALGLDIREEQDLFGGVVPHAFVATKTITHPLFGATAHAPIGWSAEFPRRVADIALEGFSAFARDDALAAGRKLLEHGAVRVKPAAGIAGLGQSVANDAAELVRALDAIDAEQMSRSGVVIERNLLDVCTYSVGQVHVADIVATYYGTQYLTRNHRGAEVYGGSDLIIVRGNFDALSALDVPAAARLAIAQARAYDDAAMQCFDGFFASRRNYDVVQGVDAVGQHRSGVLEQSWRLGGASGAEVGALQAFAADRFLSAVHATSREVYGASHPLPASADVYFRGIDPRIGPLTKYTVTEPYADTR